MVFNVQKTASFRLLLVIVLLVAIYGVIPVGAKAQRWPELAPEGNNCYPGSGWMWINGPEDPELATQVQQELGRRGIQAMVKAQNYGEVDSCGTYHSEGFDITIRL